MCPTCRSVFPTQSPSLPHFDLLRQTLAQQACMNCNCAIAYPLPPPQPSMQCLYCGWWNQLFPTYYKNCATCGLYFAVGQGGQALLCVACEGMEGSGILMSGADDRVHVVLDQRWRNSSRGRSSWRSGRGRSGSSYRGRRGSAYGGEGWHPSLHQQAAPASAGMGRGQTEAGGNRAAPMPTVGYQVGPSSVRTPGGEYQPTIYTMEPPHTIQTVTSQQSAQPQAQQQPPAQGARQETPANPSAAQPDLSASLARLSLQESSSEPQVPSTTFPTHATQPEASNSPSQQQESTSLPTQQSEQHQESPSLHGATSKGQKHSVSGRNSPQPANHGSEGSEPKTTNGNESTGERHGRHKEESRSAAENGKSVIKTTKTSEHASSSNRNWKTAVDSESDRKDREQAESTER